MSTNFKNRKYSFKIFFLFFVILFSITSSLFSQTTITKKDSIISINKEKRSIIINKFDELIFISDKNDTIVKHHGKLIDIIDDSISLDCYLFVEEITDSLVNIKRTTILNNRENHIMLKIDNLTGFYYSPKWKTDLNEVSKSLFFGSLFLGLVISPIVSMEYRQVNNNYSGFNRRLYTNMLIFSLSSVSFSISMYYISKPKYFKL